MSRCRSNRKLAVSGTVAGWGFASRPDTGRAPWPNALDYLAPQRGGRLGCPRSRPSARRRLRDVDTLEQAGVDVDQAGRRDGKPPRRGALDARGGQDDPVPASRVAVPRLSSCSRRMWKVPSSPTAVTSSAFTVSITHCSERTARASMKRFPRGWTRPGPCSMAISPSRGYARRSSSKYHRSSPVVSRTDARRSFQQTSSGPRGSPRSWWISTWTTRTEPRGTGPGSRVSRS